MTSKSVTWRVNPETPDKLTPIVMGQGFVYGGSAQFGKWLDAIANGDLVVIPKESLKRG
jgi:hypothetical protein